MKPYSATPAQAARFREERDAFRLRFRCPDCLHVVPASGACAFAFPNRDLMLAGEYLDERGWFVFCKYFELA
jgi:hypothetical protein